MKLLTTVKSLWNRLPDGAKRVIHTAWVTFAVVETAGLVPILKKLLVDQNLAAATSAAGALTLAAFLAAGTAVRVSVASLLAKR